jgi:hypothetical protein
MGFRNIATQTVAAKKSDAQALPTQGGNLRAKASKHTRGLKVVGRCRHHSGAPFSVIRALVGNAGVFRLLVDTPRKHLPFGKFQSSTQI